MLRPKDLAAFVAVADQGSIHRAATVLSLTQPAVTQAIQRLEACVGFPLLDRSGYRVKPTERGRAFLKRARALVKDTEDLRAFAAALSSGVEAQIRISIHGGIPAQGWIPLLADVPERFPATVLEMRVREGNAPIRSLMNNESDFAIAFGASVDHRILGVEGRFLGAAEFVNVMHASRIAADNTDSGIQLPQIIVADFDDPTTSYGVVEGRPYWRVADHRTKAALVAAGVGWGSVPATMVKAELEAGTLIANGYGGLQARSAHRYFLYRKIAASRGPVADSIWEKAKTLDSGNLVELNEDRTSSSSPKECAS